MEEVKNYAVDCASELLDDIIYTHLDRYEEFEYQWMANKHPAFRRLKKSACISWSVKNLRSMFANINPFLASKINQYLQSVERCIDFDIFDLIDDFDDDFTASIIKEIEIFLDEDMLRVYNRYKIDFNNDIQIGRI